jgi:hypothetical protein
VTVERTSDGRRVRGGPLGLHACAAHGERKD